MKRNAVYRTIGALAIAVAVLAYVLYQERKETTGIEINVDTSGITIQKSCRFVIDADGNYRRA